MPRINWNEVIEQARNIVYSYDTGVTLRQLFYQLVSRQVLPNKQSYYQSLSKYTAAARREGTFPPLIDRTRQILQPRAFTGPDDAKKFTEKYGRLVQVELDALEPPVLRGLYLEAVTQFFDVSKYEESCRQEEAERTVLVQ